MSVRLLKDVLAEKLAKSTMLNIPSHIYVSYCKTKTNSYLVKTPHGIVRVYKVTEV